MYVCELLQFSKLSSSLKLKQMYVTYIHRGKDQHVNNSLQLTGSCLTSND